MDTAGVIVDIDTAQKFGYDRQCYPCSEFWLRSDRTVRSVTDRGPSVPLEVIMAVFEIISISSSWSYNLESKSTYSPRPKVALSKIEFDKKKILNVTEFSFL